jgi:hypothetical protein
MKHETISREVLEWCKYDYRSTEGKTRLVSSWISWIGVTGRQNAKLPVWLMKFSVTQRRGYQQQQQNVLSIISHINQLLWFVKVKLSLCLTKHRAKRRIGQWRYSSTHSFTSALEGVKWSVSRPGRFIPRERAPGTHWVGGWVVPRAVLDAAVKRKIPSPRWESNPRTPIIQPVAQRYTDWAIRALLCLVLTLYVTKRIYLIFQYFIQ